MADNLNIKNPSVTEDALDLRTDSSGNIVSISGHSIVGGAGGGNVYFGDNEYIQFKTGTTNTFTLTSGVKDTIDHIPQIVSTEVRRISYTKNDIDDRLNDKQDKLTFEYDEANKVSAINGSALAGQGGTYYRAGTDIIIDEYNNIKVNTNGSANSTGMAFVEGMDNIASGFASHAEGLGNAVYSDYSHIEGYNNTDYKIDGLLGSNHTEGAYNKTSGVYSHNEGHANEITGYGVHVEGGYNKFYINNVSADTTHSDKTNRWNVWGISIEGMANATTAEPTSGSIDGNDYGYIHGGILKVIGNGTRTLENPSDPATEVITRSDALIIYRDGSISAAGNISANGIELGAGGGGGTSYQGRNGVNVNGGYIELTQTAYESVTSVPNISNDVNTLKGASGDWNKVSDKLDTTAFSTVSGTFLTEIPNEYVTSSNVTTQDADYVMTTTGWKVLTLPGGGMTQVIHDETLTGQGNDANSKLSVAWSALSGNTIDSAKSAGSAEGLTNGVGYSGFNDISAKFDSLTSYVPFSATVLPIGTNNTSTNNSIAIGSNNTANDLGFAVGQSNTALKRSLAFGVNNYANDISLAIGYGNSASGNNDNNQSAVNIAIGYANSAADHAAALINVCTAENYAFAAGHANSAIDNSVAFGRNTSAYFYSFDFGHSNDVRYYSYAFGRGLHYEGQWANGSQYGAFVIGGWNATTSYATTADAPLFIIGNGSNNNPSDGFIVYRDGDVTAAGKISANGMFAVSTDATLFGQSRIANVGDTTALGTNWMGVTNDGQGFLKSISGNNVGSLNGTSIQINYKPNNAYGEITVKNSNAGTDGDSKIVHVPTASYNNMTTFDPTNGPNYMLRKTASGFDIGAKVVNVTSMPQNTEANTYYFVYEV